MTTTTDSHPTGWSRLRRALWQRRRPAAVTTTAILAVVYLTSRGPAAYLALAGVAAVVLAVPTSRRWLAGTVRRARTRRQLTKGLRAVGKAVGALSDVDPPRIKRLRSTPVGEEALLKCRPGQTAELYTNLSPILRSALGCRTVQVDRGEDHGDEVWVDIIRRDAFSPDQTVSWAGPGPDGLWGDVHAGVDEAGRPVHLSLPYRGVIIGGVMDSGKSSMLTNITAAAAMSTAHLVLIDPNRVQFGPWRHRALAYAEADPDEAIGVLETVKAEIGRRLDVLRDLPGVVRKVDRAVAEAHDLHPLLLAIDELAYHTAAVGSANQRQAFGNALRDIISRGRAVLVIPVAATQRPTQDVIPRAVVDLFPYQAAFRVRNASNSDVILGDGKAKAGFDASEISASTPGVALLQAATWRETGRARRAGQDRPRRIRGCWISDDEIADLSVASLPYKPAPPPGWPLATTTTTTTTATRAGVTA